jgi:hypothetical protein
MTGPRQIGYDDARAEVLRAFVKEQSHPDCLPSMKFFGILPNRMYAYGSTREEVESKVWSAIQEAQPAEEPS